MPNPAPPRRPAGPETATRNYPLLLKRLERLMEISQSMVSTLNVKKLLRLIAAAARELTETEAASIMLFDPHSGELRFEATTNWTAADHERIVVPQEGSIAGWIVEHSQPLVVPDTRADPRWNRTVDERTDFTTRSILGVPLIAREKTIGVLEAINKTDGTFTYDDVSTLEWLAAQAAVAIVNARLFEQSDLVAELVHELRTPLTALLATSGLLQRPQLGDDQRLELALIIQRETARLSEMTTAFLEMARLESGRMHFSREPIDPAALVQECAGVIAPQAAAADLSLELAVPAGLPTLESDRDKVKQVLLNLLTNAIKYNQPGGRVGLKAQALEDHLFLSVSDTGRGIPPSAVEHVFQRFYRVADSEGYVTGTGLGLPIAKRLVQALGGDIWFETELNRGTTFHVRLPLVLKATQPLAEGGRE